MIDKVQVTHISAIGNGIGIPVDIGYRITMTALSDGRTDRVLCGDQRFRLRKLDARFGAES